MNIKLVGFTGSLREKSFNMSALKAAKELLPMGVTFDILDLSDIPFFNEDIEDNIPESVKEFIEKIIESDGIVISVPEYNYSIPPVLKNALDWASRSMDMPLSGKPLAIMSASPSLFGGSRVQYHLRQVCVRLNLLPLNDPEVFIMKAHEKFDEQGNLIDESTKTVIEKLMNALIKEINK